MGVALFSDLYPGMQHQTLDAQVNKHSIILADGVNPLQLEIDSY
jgi:TRAP-type C4-dicarboxylate transport system substrate-binding protein